MCVSIHMQVWFHPWPLAAVRWTALGIVYLMSKANVAGYKFFDILKNIMILRSGARCAPEQDVIRTVWVLLWSLPKPVQLNIDFWQFMQKHIICRPGPRAVPKKNKVGNSGNCSAHVEDQYGWILNF